MRVFAQYVFVTLLFPINILGVLFEVAATAFRVGSAWAVDQIDYLLGD